MADTISDKLVRLNEVKQQIKQSIIDKGVTVADDTPFSGYAAKIGEIQGGGGEVVNKTKFGVSIDNLLGDVDENGVILATKAENGFDGSLIKSVYAGALSFKFATTISGSSNNGLVGTLDLRNLIRGDLTYICHANRGLTTVRLDSIEEIAAGNNMSYAFYYCQGLETIVWPNLKKISGDVRYMFYWDTSLKSTGMNGVEAITPDGYTTICQYMFAKCEGLISTGLENLTTVSGTACQQMFNQCTGLTKEYFPMLTAVSSKNALGSGTYNGMFSGCSGITELHFRADTQAVIEGLSGYSSKFGATNATIYFDLIGTITVNGVAYARDEKQSIRVDGVKTFVAWKDASDNVVYTSYAGNAEPAVGTVVYSDAGTTQVGTVEGVA